MTAVTRWPVLAALAFAGWLLAAMALLLAGAYRPWAAVPLGLAMAALLIRLGDPGRRPAGGPAARWATALTLLVAVAFGVLSWVTSSEHVVLRRDPGSYTLTTSWLAEHGRLPVPSGADAFGPAPGLGPESPGFYASGQGAVVPQFMSGTPLALAPAGWLGGLRGITRGNAVISALALLAVAGLAARLGGPWAALLAALALGLAQPELHAARSPYSEPAAQLLMFGGLSLLVDAARSSVVERRLWALGGLLLGLVALVRIDGLADLLPLIAYGGVVAVTRGRRTVLALAAGLGAGIVVGLVDGVVLSRPYLAMFAGELGAVAGVGLLLGLLTVLAARRRDRAPGWLRLRGGDIAAATLGVAFAGALVVRPRVETARISPTAAISRVVGALQDRLALPHDPGRTYAEHSLHWLGWYVGVSGLVLGFVGLALLLRRALDPRDADPGLLPVLLLILGASVLVLWRPTITPDHPWADRRFVPLVLPGLVVGGSWLVVHAIGRLRRGTASRALGLGAAALLVAGLVAPAAWASAPLLATRTERGEIAALHQVCRALPEDAAVVVVGQRGRKELPQAVRGECGVPVLAQQVDAVSPLPASLAGQVAARGHRLCVLAETRAEAAAALPGSRPTLLVHLMTREDDRQLVQRPRRVVHLRVDVWLVTAG